MTAQEQQMLQGLIDRVRNTQVADKDPEAEQTLQSGLGASPDALYVLAQTVLVQEYALHQAQQQMAQLRTQNEQLREQPPAPARHTSFLGSLLGRDDDTPRAAPPPPPPATSAQPGYTPVPNYPGVAPGSTPPAYGAPAGYGQPGGYAAPGGGGFLRSALQTATGVAAGALAFEGVESLMHGFGHAAGYGTEFMPAGGFGDAAPREEVINNYYGGTGAEDSGRDAGSGSGEHSGSFVPGLDQNAGGTGNDIWSQPENASSSGNAAGFDADDRGAVDNASFGDTSSNVGDDSGADGGIDDDSSMDDSGSGLGDNPGLDDNSGAFDDNSGGFDDSGSGFDDNSGGDGF